MGDLERRGTLHFLRNALKPQAKQIIPAATMHTVIQVDDYVVRYRVIGDGVDVCMLMVRFKLVAQLAERVGTPSFSPIPARLPSWYHDLVLEYSYNCIPEPNSLTHMPTIATSLD